MFNLVTTVFFFFFFNDTATTEIYPLSLHDALPISFFTKFAALQNPPFHPKWKEVSLPAPLAGWNRLPLAQQWLNRSEEHTSELQSLRHLVCRLLLEKKKHVSTSSGHLRRRAATSRC